MKRFNSIKFLEDLIKFIDKDKNYGSCSLIVKDTKSNECLNKESVIFDVRNLVITLFLMNCIVTDH